MAWELEDIVGQAEEEEDSITVRIPQFVIIVNNRGTWLTIPLIHVVHVFTVSPWII